MTIAKTRLDTGEQARDVLLQRVPNLTALQAQEAIEEIMATLSSGVAPSSAQYIVGASDATLTAERVATDTTTVDVDLGTAGQAKWNVLELPGIAATGVAVRTAAATYTARTITGTANEITVTNGDGVSGNPTISLPTNIVLTNKNIDEVERLGINTTADSTNRLSVNSDAVLFNHNGTTSQVKVNKNATANTASHLFQVGFSGRAEFGLIGSDDFQMKTSPDGAVFTTGLTIQSSDAGLRVGVNIAPSANDGAPLGLSGTAFSDLFLASGAVVNFAAGDVTITHAADTLAFAGAATAYTFAGGPLLPSANDGIALGAAATAFSDLFLASGAVIGFNNGNYTITHTAGDLAFSGIVTLPNTGLHLLDTNASHDLIVAPGSNLTADRTLTLTTGDSDRTLTISGNATVSQDYSTSGNPQFATIELGAATDTTLARSSAGNVSIEGNVIYRADGTDVVVADGGTGVSSLTAYAVICGGTTSTAAVQSIASVGTSGQVLTSNGASALPTFQTLSASGSTLATEVATTSGSTIDFTGLPSTVKRIFMSFNAIGTAASMSLLVQIGDSGGIETTGYTSYSSFSGGSNETYTSGYVCRVNGTGPVRGQAVLTKINDNEWIFTHQQTNGNTSVSHGAGSKTLSAGPLDRVRLALTTATSFNAGSVNIIYD